MSQVHSCSSFLTVQTTATAVRNEYMMMFQNVGWALPTRSTFRYTNRQKRILHGYFMEGEESGNKMSPEEVQLLLRKKLLPEEYVSTQQIRSLLDGVNSTEKVSHQPATNQ